MGKLISLCIIFACVFAFLGLFNAKHIGTSDMFAAAGLAIIIGMAAFALYAVITFFFTPSPRFKKWGFEIGAGIALIFIAISMFNWSNLARVEVKVIDTALTAVAGVFRLISAFIYG